MAANLSVTTGLNFSLSPRNLGASANVDGFVDFGGLLDMGAKATVQAKPQPTPPSTQTPPANSAELPDDTEQQDKPDGTDVVAVAVDAVIDLAPVQGPLPALTDLVNELVDVKAKLDAGMQLSPEGLQRVDALLTDLAGRLGIDLDASAGIDLTVDGADSFAAKLAAALGTVTTELSTNVQADVSAQTKAVSDKLTALLAALNGDAQVQAEISALGDDVQLQAALDKLSKSAEVSTDAKLATTELDIPEPVRTAEPATETTKKADGEAKVDVSKAAESNLAAGASEGKNHSGKDDRQDHKSGDHKAAETKPVAAAATQDKQPDPQVSASQPGQQARVDAVAAPRVVQVGYQTSQQQLNLPQLAFEMARQVQDGNTRFQIRLDPADLGKIDVRLDIDANGKVNARLMVEKAETLDMMQRDQKGLERALQQAGLDGAKTNLEFSLKQNNSNAQQDQAPRAFRFENETSVEAETAPVPTVNLYRGSLSASGVNIIA